MSSMKSSASGRKSTLGKFLTGRLSLLFGFDTKLQQRLAEFHNRREAVVITNSEMKASKWWSKLEVMLLQSTETKRSSFDVSTSESNCNAINLDELQGLRRQRSIHSSCSSACVASSLSLSVSDSVVFC